MNSLPFKKIAQSLKKIFHLSTKDLELFIIPILLFSILLILYGFTLSIKYRIYLTKLSEAPNVKMHLYPQLNLLTQPILTAYAAIAVDTDTKKVLFSKNSDFHFSMASTTKIITGLTAVDYFRPRDTLEIKTATVEGSIIGLPLGDTMYFEDLLYAMYLPSANDAALAVAQNYPGGEEAFVSAMNNKAQELRLYNTHYADPAGLNDDGNYTTVADLARLGSIAIKNPELAKIFSTKQYTIHNVSGSKDYELYNLNKLLGSDGVTGVKTGFTEGAGGVLVTSVHDKGHTIIFVVMKSEDRFADTEILLHYVMGNIMYTDPLKEVLSNR